tara:strand:+ start:2969 stop:3160 length:192 start_codon:yes stop_codon:yes gene_type:complete
MSEMNIIDEPTMITAPYEPYDNLEIATMNAIDFIMKRLEEDSEKERVAAWIEAKYGKKRKLIR